MRLTKCWILLVTCSLFSFQSFSQEKYSKVKIPVPNASIKKFVFDHLNVDHYKQEENNIIVVLNRDELNTLRRSGNPFSILIDDVVQHTTDINKNAIPGDVNRAALQGDGCQKVANIISTPAAFGTGGSLRLGAAAGNPGYFTYAEMSAAMLALQTAHPTRVTRFSIGNSAAGTPIYGVKISDNVTVDENEPEVLYTALQHAREAIGGTSLIFFMQYLAANYSNADQKIRQLVDNREIFIIPCMNPDGYAFNYGGSSASYPVTGGGLWRKNRRHTGGVATNIGVDLNRNYSVDFGNCAGASSSCGSASQTADTYFGPSAFSEPETKALRDFVYQRHFVNAIDQHCFGPYYSLPYGRPSLHPVLNNMDSSYYTYVPALMGLYNGHRAGNSPETVNYEVAGGIKDWLLMGDIGTGTKGKIYGMTGEAGGGDFWAPVAEIMQLCKENCFQNLQLAYAAGSYIEHNDRSDLAINSLTGKFSFDIRRVGLGNNPVTVSIVPISNNIQSVGAPVTKTIVNYYEQVTDSISYTLPVTVSCSPKVVFAWKVESGGITTYDTVTKFYKPVTLLYDDMEGSITTNWATTISPTGPTGWSFTSQAAFAGSRSMTESPTGNYTASSTRTATCKTIFDLADARDAYLCFWVKHRAENFRDRLQVQVSTNGSTWTPICGSTTVSENNTTNDGFLGGLPALTGIRDIWTRELFDLSAYKGSATVSLRFVFLSDGDASAFAFEKDDGFYLDNVTVQKTTNAPVPAPPVPTASSVATCKGTAATLTATGAAILGWYSAAIGGTYLGGGSTFITPVLNAPATYYVQDSLCAPSASRRAVTVSINNPSTISRTSAAGTDAQTLCRGTTINSITYATGGGATGAAITSGTLPPGVTGSFSGGVYTVSGTAASAGNYSFTITTTGPCSNVSVNCSIQVIDLASVSITSLATTATQVICVNNSLDEIIYTVGNGGTGAALTGSLPPGVTGSYQSGIFKVSGTPSAPGVYTYEVSATGSCNSPALQGMITVNPNAGIALASALSTEEQLICLGNAIQEITYNVANANAASVVGLPAGITGVLDAGIFRLSGTPTQAGVFNYSITATANCNQAVKSGIIRVTSITADITKNNTSVCGNGYDGSIYLTPSGGTAPYTYSWTGMAGPGAQTPYSAGNVSAITGLATGFYTATITDATGCSTTYADIQVKLGFAVNVTYNGTISSACAPTGSIVLYGSAGVPPYSYSLDGTNYQSSNSFEFLAPGQYTGYIRDAGGCVSSTTITMNAAEPMVVTSTATGATSCSPTGRIQLFRTGGMPPYSYSIDNINFQPENTFTGLAAGTYTAFVRDSKGCQESLTGIVVSAGIPISISANKTPTSTCVNNGTLQAQATGGAWPYSYSIDNINYQPTGSFTGLGAGSHIVYVKDAENCIGTLPVSIAANPMVVTAYTRSARSCSMNNGIIQLFRTGGTGPYTYSLDGITYQPTNLFNGLAAGVYMGHVKDSKGCVSILGLGIGPDCDMERKVSQKNRKILRTNPAFNVNAYPNPTTSAFMLDIETALKEQVHIVVTDIAGRNIHTATVASHTYYFGEGFVPGVYLVTVIQGQEKRVVKVVKR